MILSLDMGTTSISAVLYDTRRRVAVCSAECPNDAGITGLPADRHEQCAATLVAAAGGLMDSLIRQSGVSPDEIVGLALTGQQHGVVVVDADWQPLTNLITWRDQRAAAVPESLRKHAHAANTGCFLHPGYGGLTLHHLIHHGGLPAGAHQVLSITGLLAARLTGRGSIDETMAASWGILDVQSGQWHHGLLDRLGIPAGLLPEIAPSCRPLGPAVAPGSSGLTSRTMVFSPVGDNQAGFAGVGDDWGEQAAVVNLGTSSQLSVFRPAYAFSPMLETRPFPGGGFLQVYAALCGGWAYAYLAEFFQQIAGQIGGVTLTLPEVFDRMQALAATTGSNGLIADTRFAGERNGDTATGTIGGINTTNFTPANLVRAFANGIAAELAGAARQMDFDGRAGLTVVGNAARRNPLLVKALEQQFSITCRLIASGGGAAALGAARLVARLNPG